MGREKDNSGMIALVWGPLGYCVLLCLGPIGWCIAAIIFVAWCATVPGDDDWSGRGRP
jgi:hypothetical protein